MLKVICFEVDTVWVPPKSVKPMKKQIFYNHSPVTDFIESIGEENVVSISHLNKGTVTSACAVFYRDDALLTCPQCGKEISNGFNFCPNCAAKLN